MFGLNISLLSGGPVRCYSRVSRGPADPPRGRPEAWLPSRARARYPSQAALRGELHGPQRLRATSPVSSGHETLEELERCCRSAALLSYVAGLGVPVLGARRLVEEKWLIHAVSTVEIHVALVRGPEAAGVFFDPLSRQVRREV